MSEKLSKRMHKSIPPLRWGKYEQFRRWADEVAALEQQLTAKDEEIARLRTAMDLEWWDLLFPEGTDTPYEPVDWGRWLDAYTDQIETFMKRRAALAETPATPIRQCKCDVDKGYRDPGCVRCIPKSEPPAAPEVK